jgi:hypothetical protein
MIKPHEEEWKTGEGVLSGALYSGDKWIGSFSNPERARLAVHAPKLATVLLRLLRESADDRGVFHTEQCWNAMIGMGCLPSCRDARAVLRDAGVLQ